MGVLSGANGIGHLSEVTCLTGPLQNEDDTVNLTCYHLFYDIPPYNEHYYFGWDPTVF